MAANRGLKLIAGIDYGTTYSGLCFTLSNAADFNDIKPWTKFPGASSHHAEFAVKAPTRIAFEDENDELDENAWGYEIEPGMKIYAFTKLLLDESSLQSDYDDPNLYLPSGGELMQLPKGKSAKDVAREYLKCMYKMFEKATDELFGSTYLDNIPIDFWITVPASWSETAKLLTKTAAIDAGFGTRPMDRVMLIPEPEAAAHYALKSGIHRLENFVQPNTGVMVCDCGGGTVDITTYEVEETQPTLKLREIAVGVAGKCGGTFVDRNLFNLLGHRFGNAFTSLRSEDIGPGSSFMDLFEGLKKDFARKVPSRRVRRIPLIMPLLKQTPEMAKYYEQISSMVLLTQQDFKFLFDPVVDMIIGLINDQLSQIKEKNETAIETIVLVGGFGSSPYLKEVLSDWCRPKNIRLTTPISGAWSAVVCGAVLRGLEGTIVRNKKCRRHYGHTLSEVYDSISHKDYDRTKRHVWTDEFSGEEWLSGFLFWEVGKGSTINESTEINSDFTTTSTGSIKKTGTHKLYSCSLDVPPGTTESDRVEKVGTVRYDLSGVDASKVRAIVKGGVTHYEISLTLNIRLDDEMGHLVFRILHDGNEVGRAGIDLNDTQISLPIR